MQNEEEIFGTVEPVAVEKEEMIDFGLVEDEKAAEFIDHEIEEIVEASVALESYQQILTAAKWDGISKQTAKAMLIGLKRVDKVLGAKSELVIALEDETNGDMKRIGNEQSKSVTKEGLGAKAKALWEKFKALMQKAMEKAKALWEKLFDKNQQTATKASELKQIAREEHSGPNGANGGRKVTIPARLAFYAVIDDKPVDPSYYHELADWCFNTMAKHVQDGIDQVYKAIGDSDLEGMKAVVGREVPAYTGKKYPNITINSNDSGGWAVVTGTESSDAVIQVRELSAYTAALDKVKIEAEFLTEHRHKVLSLQTKLMKLLMDGHANVQDVDSSIINVLIDVLKDLKALQEQAQHLYMFLSKAQSAILEALHTEI